MRPWRRRNYFIHKRIQTKYAILTVSLLLLYTMILLVAVFAPYAMALFSDLPLSERSQAAEVLLMLDKNIWPGIGVVIILFGVLSIFITHKLAGPVFVFERMAKNMAEGDLTVRAHLRDGDDLHDLAEYMNQMADSTETVLMNLDKEYKKMSLYVAELESELDARDISEKAIVELVKKIDLDKDGIRKILERYNYRGKNGN